MVGLFTQLANYLSRLMSGGTLEIVLLIVIIVVGVILLLLLLWVLWKLSVALAKGLLWLGRWGTEKAKETSASRREARLAAPPKVATGWASSKRIGLRRALAQARRLADPEALRIVVIAGSGASDLCRGLSLTPPGVGTIGIAAGGDTVLVDASRADTGMLRRLAAALPWRRPVDAVAAFVEPGGIASEALSRCAAFSRALGLRTALHFVFPGGGKTAAWEIIDAHNRNGDAICAQLAADAARLWLSQGERAGLRDLAMAQSRELPAALDRALAVAPSSVDIASLSLGGLGLRGAVAQTTERTRPAAAPSVARWLGVSALALGVVLAVLVAVVGVDRSTQLRSAVSAAAREAGVPWSAEGIGTIPSAGRIGRIAGMSVRLAESSGFSPLMPLASLAPNAFAAHDLGAAFLEGYVLRPLGDALDRRARTTLQPNDDAGRWVEDARLVSEWFAAWQALDEDPSEVDIRRLFVTAFGGDKSAWVEGTEQALIRTGAKPPPPALGGLNIDRLTVLARENFIVTMQRWADNIYTNGPVAVAARRSINRSADWREQHAALVGLRTALQDPSQQWLTAAEDQPDYAFELRVLGRALALPLLGQANALEAKAAVSRIRIDAREHVEYFILPEIGPLMVRTSSGSQGNGRGPSLSLAPRVSAWLEFLDKIANAGFAEFPRITAAPPPVGTVTLDPVAVATTRAQLRVFDQFAGDLPTGLPPAVAEQLLHELASELTVGVALRIEQALRSVHTVGVAIERAERMARVAPALDDLAEIESWLRLHRAQDSVLRILKVSARVAESALWTSAEALIEEDPLGIHPDPAADGGALVRRFERGLARLRRIYEQYASPFLERDVANSWAAVNWHHIAADIQAFERGDGDAALSGLEGMLQAYAANAEDACAAPRPAVAAGRDDYIAKTLRRVRAEFDRACGGDRLEEARAKYLALADYFDRHIAWLWPYSSDPDAPELPASTLSAFVTRLHADRHALATLDEPFAKLLLANADFWSQDQDGGAAVRFRVVWRARPSEERLAENVIDFTVDGAELDEDDIYTWRYGAPLSIGMRLAKESIYRFAGAADLERREWRVGGDSNGALLRLFADLSHGSLVLDADVADAEDARQPLRVTARVVGSDGAPLALPAFPELAVQRGRSVLRGGGG